MTPPRLRVLLPILGFTVYGAGLLSSSSMLQTRTLQSGVQQNAGTDPTDEFKRGNFVPDPYNPNPDLRPALPPQTPRPCYPGPGCNEVPPPLPTGTFYLGSVPPEEHTCLEKYAAQLNATLSSLTPLYMQLYHTSDQAQYSKISRQWASGWQQAFKAYWLNTQKYCLPAGPLAVPPVEYSSSPAPQPTPQPVPPANTPERPFACAAYLNDWFIKAVRDCRGDDACQKNANATVRQLYARFCASPSHSNTTTSNSPGPLSPSGNEGPFLQGFTAGVSQCINSLSPQLVTQIGLALAAQQFQKLNALLTFVNAYARGSAAASLAQMASFPLPGQTVTYRASDLPSTTNPYAIGFAEGKRFCGWEIAWVGATNGAGASKTPLKGSVTVNEEAPANMQLPTGLSGPAQGQAPNRVTSGPTNTRSKSMPTGLGGQLGQNQSGPANPPPGLANLLGDLTWLKTINPSGCQLNCGQCAVAVAKALKGQGISSAPYSCTLRFSGTTARVMGTVDSQIEQELGGKFSAYGSAGDANNAIYNAGNGAQGVVSASGGTGGGHFFNIVNDNGNVRLLDGQTGAEISWSSFKPGTTFALLPVK